jgi:hypothetical protein
VIAFGLQHCGNDFPDGFLVIDDKYVFDVHVWLAPRESFFPAAIIRDSTGASSGHCPFRKQHVVSR